MTIFVKQTAKREYSFKTEIRGRKYKGHVSGCNEKEALKRFRARIVAAEMARAEEKRREQIEICLNCTAEMCKGTCAAVEAIKIQRGKGIL